ncbi:aminotransferase class I/II-fold pyridoxal phosphate-dependent enzyme [Paenibacillus sp. J5C_2022]|uniref:aminotransferase class I/II-fold pyridoxal phosphate-dependent enzyme n=1 Tax=Paenibacillus sp. J5C2022 TaxID=2977129 RepID=UPI0021D0C8C2|nr:aminotransferase class I/II-fold pyridoxal phosphate-dependent enzyme [Paenibacillus sp. J5C2022]MCU6707249.1 aminotransferase class I/II-fold pyridoxal phosphate-dependent enzyme [Paenibacillus sp. J5C2022]
MDLQSDYNSCNSEQLRARYALLKERYDAFKREGLKLDMSRGKPCKEQLELSMDMLRATDADDFIGGTDYRNYGGIDGIPAAKKLFADILEASDEEVIIGGNSSLNMMYDTIVRALINGVNNKGGEGTPWSNLPSVKFICPSPGYDRHFAICEHLNIEMITVEMLESGPDMDAIERLVREDDTIKGIWCVPKYSNPEGTTYSDDTVDRLAALETKAEDFRIFWDNAYAVHHLSDQHDKLKNILEACKAAGHPDRVYLFASTSKITFPGAGVAAMATSKANADLIRKQLSFQTIGPDKMNQQRHARFLGDMAQLERHMARHAALIAPKFSLVLDRLESELGGRGIASWNKPSGGYFISLNTMDGCAREVVRLASECGVTLTGAGATFPYGRDPRDRNIRIAPTFPSLAELDKAIDILCICVGMTSIDRILANR